MSFLAWFQTWSQILETELRQGNMSKAVGCSADELEQRGLGLGWGFGDECACMHFKAHFNAISHYWIRTVDTPLFCSSALASPPRQSRFYFAGDFATAGVGCYFGLLPCAIRHPLSPRRHI